MPRLQAEKWRKHGLILSKDEIFLFSKNVWADPSICPASYSMANCSSFPVSEVAGAEGQLLTSI
jgi:hypothetical protein